MDSSSDYEKIFNQMHQSIRKADQYFCVETVDKRKKGIVSTGMLMSSAEDIASGDYVSAIIEINRLNDKSHMFLASPAFDEGRYVVFFILFVDRISYTNYCIEAHEKTILNVIDAAPYLFN